MSHTHKSPDLGLTEKNTAFARAVVLDVRRDKTMGDHYQDTFGGNMTRASYSCCASRLWKSPPIQAYAEKLREEMRERFMVTVESLIAELEEARQVGKTTESAAPMVAATMGKAKLMGLDKQIIEHRGDIPVGAVTIEVVSARPENNGN